MKKIFLGLALLGTLTIVNASTTSWITPTANGSYSSWNSSSTDPKYTLVDEVSCNGNVDYVSTHTLNARESYSIPLTSIPDGSVINAVYIAPCALQDTETTATSSLSMFSVVNGVTSSYAGTYFLKGTTTPSAYSYAYIPNTPVVKNASTKVEAGVVLVTGPVGGARLSRIAAVVSYSAPAPTAPTNLVAIKNGTTTAAVLTWNDNSSNETYFMVERSTNGTTFSLLAYLPTNTTKYITSTQAIGTYYYRVRAYNSGGYSQYTNSVSITIVPIVTIPTAPSNIAVYVSSSTQIIYWTDNSSDEIGFVYEKSTDYGATFTPYGTTTDPYFLETDKTFGIYYYRVRAYNTAGYSAYSNTAVLSIEPQISAPSNITAGVYNSNSVSIRWDDNSTNETGFLIERSLNGTSTWVQFATTTANYSTSGFFSDDNLTVGTYYYRVRAYNALGYSAYSLPSASVSIVPPVAPSNMTAGIYNSNSVGMRWDDNSLDELGFLIERSVNGTSSWTQFATTTANSNLFSDDNLTVGTYYYRVRAYNSLGYSAYSSPTAPVSVVPPVAPSNLTAGAYVVNGINSIGIRWDDNSTDETGFLIEKSINGTSTWAQFATLPAGINMFSDDNLTTGEYYYRVRAYNGLGYSWYSLPSLPVYIYASTTGVTP